MALFFLWCTWIYTSTPTKYMTYWQFNARKKRTCLMLTWHKKGMKSRFACYELATCGFTPGLHHHVFWRIHHHLGCFGAHLRRHGVTAVQVLPPQVGPVMHLPLSDIEITGDWRCNLGWKFTSKHGKPKIKTCFFNMIFSPNKIGKTPAKGGFFHIIVTWFTPQNGI